ncbi:MAG: SBBP repeat-containing protein [Ignavibacteria bacterium]|nr:SBBP repeat-containing protein [Ignavibacteria bacterium]
MMKSLINKKLLVRESFFRINHYTIILTLLLLLKCFECLYSNEFRLDKLYLDENENRGFEKNCGQVGDFSGGYLENIFFTSKNKGYTLFVTHKGVSYVIYRYKEVNAANYLSPFSGSLPKENLLEFSRIDVELVGADISKDKIVYEDTLPGYSNYYLPQCPQGVLFVKTYKKVRIREIYNGIDWIWIYKNGKLHHEFEIKPNARISDIKMKVKFADIKITDGNKKIIYSTPLGEIEEGEVVAFSESENMLCSFNVLNGIICFNIQGWNRKNKVVIDPPLALLWATYYGGSGWDTGGEIVTDSLGNIFVAGYTESANFPIQAPDTGAYFQGTNAGSTDLFVLKFNNLGIRQ